MTQSLRLRDDQVLLVTTNHEGDGTDDDDTETETVQYLGPPREGIYDRVPAELWPELEALIDARDDQIDLGDYRRQVEGDYRNAKGF